MAWSPATPAPSTKTRAGAMVPAAVIIIGMVRPKAWAASITARYPARLLCEESTSMLWARLMRGISSMAKATMPASA